MGRWPTFPNFHYPINYFEFIMRDKELAREYQKQWKREWRKGRCDGMAP